METRLLAHEHAATISEIAGWANDMLGKEVPGEPGYIVVSVVQFQILDGRSGYAALMLAEVMQRPPEIQVMLKEADIEVIEELTSSIDEPA